MKRNRTTRHNLCLETLEPRQLLAGITTSLLKAKVLPAPPAIVPALVAKTAQPAAASAKVVANTSPLKTAAKLPAPLTNQKPEIESQAPQTPGAAVTTNNPVSPNQIAKLPGLLDASALIDEALAKMGDDDALLLMDVDAIFGQHARGDLGVFTTVAASVNQPGAAVGERGQTTTRYGSAASMFGELTTAGSSLAPVNYDPEEGVSDASKGETAKRYEGTLLGAIGTSIAGDNETPTGQALQQALDEMDKLGAEASHDDDSGEGDAGASSEGGGSTGDGGQGDKGEDNSNPIVKHHSSEDQSLHFFEYADGTVRMVNIDTGEEIIVKPDGTVIETDADGNRTEYKPSTPATDEPPLPAWLQQQIDQAMAELRGAQNYQPGSGDIDWGDFDNATGYLLSQGGGNVPDLKALLLGAQSVRPQEIEQGSFQQPDEGNVDPHPNEGN